MSAAEALKAARAAGIQLAIKREDLVLKAPAPPSPVVIDFLCRHKTEVVALLRPTTIGWTRRFTKRIRKACRHQYDGGAPRAWAETLARLDPVQAPSDTPPMRNETTTEGGKRFCRNTRHVEAPLHERRNT